LEAVCGRAEDSAVAHRAAGVQCKHKAALETFPASPPPHPLDSALHEHFPVIPEPIREYIEEVKAQLEEVTLSPGGCSSFAAASVALVPGCLLSC
jgi:hypothetical protein